jgi:carbon-monoxide dehydrogenase large subunit
MDYAIPNASDMPTFQNECFETLTPMNPLGIRSGGEAGTTPALGAITNAIADALKEYNVCDVEMPATSYKIWEAIKFASISK